jgi:hypothetical protein
VRRVIAAAGREDRLVLICRCAWHPFYQGYPLLSGVASWRGWRVQFTDGICDKCLARFRAEHRRFLHPRPAEPTSPLRATPTPPEAA